MQVLVTGSSGHLGEALVRVLSTGGHQVVGVDQLRSPYTDLVGSITDSSLVAECMRGADVVIHTATLHKPHVATHSYQDFIDTNVAGTLCLLEQAVAEKVGSFVFTSTTSVFGSALNPPHGDPAVWVTERLDQVPKNAYGVTKRAAEDLVELFHYEHGLPGVILRTSRFFPEPDDDPRIRGTYDDINIKVNEMLYRRVDLADVVSAHLAAVQSAPSLGFARYIISATTPFSPEDVVALGHDAASLVRKRVPQCPPVYDRLGWKLFPTIDRVYDNKRARDALGWEPKYDFRHSLARLEAGEDPRSDLAIEVGAKGYVAAPGYPWSQTSRPGSPSDARDASPHDR